MKKFPTWYNLAFALKYPYMLIETNEGFEITFPQGKAILNEHGQPVSYDGEVPEDLKKLESRQLQLFKKEVPDKFLVIGTGGVGFWFVVTMLAVNPHAKFIMFDDDVTRGKQP